MFFEFTQNNSGGNFDFNESLGITHYVIIEANDFRKANDKAENIGLYFDGSLDCPCCGNRWYEQWGDVPGHKTPKIYGMTPTKYVKAKDSCLWMKKGFEVAVHYKNGQIKWY